MIERDGSSCERGRRKAFSRRGALRSLCGVGLIALSQAVWPAVKGDVAPACAATREGVVRSVHIGFSEGDKAGVRRQLLEMLNEGK